MEYPFYEIEKKWQNKWRESSIFKAHNDKSRNKYYILSMFPYPSGPLHMGHVSNYSISDAITRNKMQAGFNVLQPMGYDSFGMPAENFAIKNNSHPSITTEKNIKIMQEQFKMLGFAIDWEREFATSRPDYYRWGQWLFQKMYEKKLVYKKKSFVNWCDDCQTVLANEQVEDNKCWRCDSEVRQKDIEQWFFRITQYAEELLDFSQIIDWPERVKIMQKNWIGKSVGTEVNFCLIEDDPSVFNNQRKGNYTVSKTLIKVFTTRPDTLFGVTFMALPPEHPLVVEWLEKESPQSELAKFCQRIMNADKISRLALDTTKEGIFSGRYCLNPMNDELVQIWVTNYVLADYGTGAVMGVPAHDQRDFEFSQKYGIHQKIVIQNQDGSINLDQMQEAYTAPGFLVNSGIFDGMASEASIIAISKWLEHRKQGKETITYRLRDWGISRQRYWGNPIPIVYCQTCGEILVPEKDLPVELPMNVQVGRTTQNPLLSVPDWINTPCPKCGKPAQRETDTMDTFVCSSWYYARYADPQNHIQVFDSELANYWLPVDQYIGGIEHACMHLLYARFFHKFMRDLGIVKSNEPFARLLTQGMVLKDGFKMSKSKGNTVDPQEYIDRYGADTIRTFVLFASPPEKDVEWSDDGVKGAFRFLNRLWIYYDRNKELFIKCHQNGNPNISMNEVSQEIKELRYQTHYTIKKIVDDFNERRQLNTNIAAIMELFNLLSTIKTKELNLSDQYFLAESAFCLPQLLYPFAPHLAEEIWSMLGGKTFLHLAGIPKYNPTFLVKEFIVYAIQVNGRVRGIMELPSDTSEEDIKKAALEVENIQKTIMGKNIQKIIIVKGKLVSIVV